MNSTTPTAWSRAPNGDYCATINSRRVVITLCNARGGYRSWVVTINDSVVCSYPKLATAKRRAEEIAQTK